MSKSNFHDRAQVNNKVGELLREGAIICTLCGGPLIIHGCYPRQIVDEYRKIHKGWIAQGRCVACKKYPALIPDFIMPQKHYEGAVIEAAISKAEEEESLRLNESPADDSTVRRWINEFKERGARAVGWLRSKLFIAYGVHISTLEMQSKKLLKQLASLALKLHALGSGGVIGSVNIILTRYNAGFL